MACLSVWLHQPRHYRKADGANLLKTGYELTVFNRFQPPVQELVTLGATAVDQMFTALTGNGKGELDHTAPLTGIEELSNYSLMPRIMPG